MILLLEPKNVTLMWKRPIYNIGTGGFSAKCGDDECNSFARCGKGCYGWCYRGCCECCNCCGYCWCLFCCCGGMCCAGYGCCMAPIVRDNMISQSGDLREWELQILSDKSPSCMPAM